MKRTMIAVVVTCIVGSLVLVGCGPAKVESSQAAIQKANTMQTVQEKTDYLIGQAKVFYNSQDFQGAIDIAQNVLRYLDKDSQEALSLIEKAKADLTAQAKKAAEDLKKGFSGIGTK
jgi:hypothetical protein